MSRLLKFSVKWPLVVPYQYVAPKVHVRKFSILINVLVEMLHTYISQIFEAVNKVNVSKVNFSVQTSYFFRIIGVYILNFCRMLTTMETYSQSFLFPQNFIIICSNDIHAPFSIKLIGNHRYLKHCSSSGKDYKLSHEAKF